MQRRVDLAEGCHLLFHNITLPMARRPLMIVGANDIASRTVLATDRPLPTFDATFIAPWTQGGLELKCC